MQRIKNETITPGLCVSAARIVIEFIKGFDKDTFVYDWKTRSAVLYQLTVVGEAVKRLSKEFRTEDSQIPWALIAGMCDNHDTWL